MTLELYYSDFCPYCVLVLRAIDDLKVRDRIQFRDTAADPSLRARLIEMNGRGTVPCLVVDGSPMLESRDIVAWLRKTFA